MRRLLAVAVACTCTAASAAAPTPAELWSRRGPSPGFRLHAAGDGAFVARNRDHGLALRFDAAGVTVRTSPDGAPLRLVLASAGRGARPRRLPLPVFSLDGPARVETLRGELVEWWENGPEGVEHGAVLRARPPGTGPLALEVEVAGAGLFVENERARLEARGGAPLLYGGLRAFDADGRTVPSRLRAGERGTIRLEVDDDGARYPLTIDPLLTAQLRRANHAWAELGDAVAVADVNGDGFKDVLGGAPYYQPVYMGPDRGRVFVFLGGAAGMASAPAWTRDGTQDAARFGLTLASAGDVNRDGTDDVLIGSPFFDASGADVGRAELYLGSATGLSASAAWSVTGTQAGEMRGVVAGAGDVNHDGYADVLVGAPNRAPGGAAFLYLGSASGLATSPAWTATGGTAATSFGFALASAGDVNGDGFADVVVGAYDSTVGGLANAGEARLYLGSASGLGTSPAWTVSGSQAGELLGEQVGSAGDVDHDGYDDVVIGSPQFAVGATKVGKLQVYRGSASGPATTATWTLLGTQDGDWFGGGFAGGDVNGDGYSDLALGAYRLSGALANEGAALVVYGSPTGLAAAPAWTAFGGQVAAGNGYAIGVGDIDRDGRSDVVAGMPFYESIDMLDGEGAVNLYLGCADANRDGVCDGAADGGATFDAGARVDAGAPPDAGAAPDGGRDDAGLSGDAGLSVDAGLGADGGWTADGGERGDAGSGPGDAGALDVDAGVGAGDGGGGTGPLPLGCHCDATGGTVPHALTLLGLTLLVANRRRRGSSR
jgi:hypothetical protein